MSFCFFKQNKYIHTTKKIWHLDFTRKKLAGTKLLIDLRWFHEILLFHIFDNFLFLLISKDKSNMTKALQNNSFHFYLNFNTFRFVDFALCFDCDLSNVKVEKNWAWLLSLKNKTKLSQSRKVSTQWSEQWAKTDIKNISSKWIFFLTFW